MSTRMPLRLCYKCGAELDAATVIDEKEATPSDGDVSICGYCGHVMIFENNIPRNPTGKEMLTLAADLRILQAQHAIDLVNSWRRK